MNTEPRFLLDKDSICFGCPEYKHVSETNMQIHLYDIDENGGIVIHLKYALMGT